MTLFRPLLLLSLAQVGCAATSGRDWLSTPIEQQAQPTVASADTTELAVDARPRLNHTVTLGEVYEPEPMAVVGDGGPAPIQVNVQPVIINNVGGYGYGGYGYSYGYGYGGGYARGVTSRARVSSGAPTKVGGDFPAPRDSGPRALR